MTVKEIIKLINLYANDVKLYSAIEPVLGKGEFAQTFETIYHSMNKSKQALIEAIKQYKEQK